MAHIRLLERTLANNVAWNKARINFLAKFLVALIQVKTVNLVQVANAFSGRAQPASNYKRVQRFLRLFELSYAEVAFFVVKLVGLPAPWALTLDRTDWYLGNTPLNVMTLGICYKGIAFPLLWTILEKKGCSDSAERIDLLEEFGRLFGFATIDYLCADREFVGKVWLAYLSSKGVDFRIRLRANTKITNRRGQAVAARSLFSSFRIGQPVVLKGARRVLGLKLQISGMKLKAGEFLIVASARPSDRAIAEYAKRWEIETLFGCMKSRGFCLEQTHVTEPERLRKLVALLALAFCWAHISRIVPQRRDVDNYFGTTIEPDLIKYLNFPVLTPAEHLSKTRTLTITFPSGEREEAFFAGPEASNRFMKVDIIDTEGKIIASPYIRSETAQAGQYRDIQIEWTLVVHDLAMVGALIKSAYLTLFALVGYRYALDALGSMVRRPLAAFFNDRASKQKAVDYFEQFQGAVIVSLEGVLDTIPDTLGGGTMLFHYSEGGRKSGILFGVSLLFRVNSTTIIVTLPAYDKYGFSLIALKHYRELLKNRGMRHAIHLVRLNNDQFEISPKPMDISYVSSTSPAT